MKMDVLASKTRRASDGKLDTRHSGEKLRISLFVTSYIELEIVPFH